MFAFPSVSRITAPLPGGRGRATIPSRERRPRRFVFAEGFAMTGKRVIWLTGAALLMTAGAAVWLIPPEVDPWHVWFGNSEPEVIENRLVGISIAELREVYGEPVRDEPWELKVSYLRCEVMDDAWNIVGHY